MMAEKTGRASGEPTPPATPQPETLLDVPHAEVDALVEAIYAERRALSPPDVERLQQRWDTRETALRALVEHLDEYDRIDGCSPQNPWCYDPTYSNADHYAGHRAAKREQIDALREALSRLLEQEP